MPGLDIYSLLKTELMVGIPDGLADKLGDMQKAEDGLCILDEAAIDIIKKLEKELGVSLHKAGRPSCAHGGGKHSS